MSADPTPDVQVTVEGTAGMDLVATCRPMTDGASDPTWRMAQGSVERAMSTPDGPVALRLRIGTDGVVAGTWGPGTAWLVQRLPALLGSPAPDSFRSELHPLVDRLHRRAEAVRFGASLRLADSVVPVILGQRVTSREARRTWWTLVRRLGAPAPGPLGLPLPPDPRHMARLSDAEWHVLGVERQRADAIRRALGVLRSLEAAAERSSEEFQQAVCMVPGLGPWTATSWAASVLGDTDAPLLGDLHVPNNVAHLLAGEPRGTDERMLELLEPWRGHRARVQRLLGRAGHAPRRGPKYTPLPIARW